MELKFTDDEFKYLQDWEYRFFQAVKADYVSVPHPQAIREIHRIWCKISGRAETLRESCYHCVFRLMKDMGKVYFDDKAERERRASEEAKKQAEIKPTTSTKAEEGTTISPTPKKAVKGRKTSKNKK